jgi:large subunit ribosomal protein L4
MQLANARIAIAHTKTRGERRGSTRKLYRQKGTGRARAGSSRSPIRKKGGVAFGPRNDRNFTLAMNRKERQKALFCVLSSKVRDNLLVVVKELESKEISTKSMNAIMQKLPLGKTALVALHEKNENIEKSINNLKTVKAIQSSYLNMADLMKYETLVLSEDGVKQLNALVA